MAMICCELKWIRRLLRDLHVHYPYPVLLYCGSQAAMHITVNPVFHEKTKHIEINCHFVYDEYQAYRIILTYVPSQSQLADIFIKALGHAHFCALSPSCTFKNFHTPT